MNFTIKELPAKRIGKWHTKGSFTRKEYFNESFLQWHFFNKTAVVAKEKKKLWWKHL